MRLANRYLNLAKNTSLAIAIVGLTDLLLAAKQALADPQLRTFIVEGYVFVALIYAAFCFFISRYSRALERRLRKGNRRDRSSRSKKAASACLYSQTGSHFHETCVIAPPDLQPSRRPDRGLECRAPATTTPS